MPKPDDHIHELVQIKIKAAMLTKDTIEKAIQWYLFNKTEKDKFKVTVGKTDMNTLNATEKTVKFLPIEIDRELMKLYSKEFKKYSIHFAVEKQSKGNYMIAFAGRNMETVEHAMKKVVEEVARIQKEKEKSGIGKIKEYNEAVHSQAKESTKERERKKVKDRSR
ncbi:DUF3801 domain-containing protein [Clostridium formicaceticum]|uniref:PcfB family protein n=1 Tax=Clostridium formicaceticum TaxID=1497 RepID=A0AAC9RPZ8_9CLOT|nr:DUF3801 domain-containing protein [Clostridium formicaceticum]AOY74746.1 hypothetical protein BJL90_01515 [Clostridium formicaceticum]ARE89133.1 hypothetical protein CLFO_35390 [Clostridium formicaceticum]